MSHYRYCICGAGHGKPTAAEDLSTHSIIHCYNCNRKMDQVMSIKEWIVDIDERLRELEKKHEPGPE